jgi:dTDP-4-amino-4,6-dideoxygalactose transaminase
MLRLHLRRRSHRLASEVISIPIFPELSAPQRDAVIAAVASFLAA